jgi:hypothetical protein
VPLLARAAELETKGGDLNQLSEAIKQADGVKQQIEQERTRPVEAMQPRRRQMVAARPLDRTPQSLDPRRDPRLALADWVLDPKNEYFSGAMVNRLWKHFFAVGLVEPVDDLRATNPPSNRELWQALNAEFVKSDYDLRHMIRLILNSRTYQLSSETRPGNVLETRYYSHYYPRRLAAEPLLDAIAQATGVPEHFPGYPLGVRAVQIADPGVILFFGNLRPFAPNHGVRVRGERRNDAAAAPALAEQRPGAVAFKKWRRAAGEVTRC